MILMVISGGQTGADQAGWRAARRFGVATGGWMPKGFLTEDGPRRDLAELYEVIEHSSPQYPPRTRQNVATSDVTLWFGSTDTAGLGCTAKACREESRPLWLVESPLSPAPSLLASMLRDRGVYTLNVAGNRESKSPGIGGRVEEYLCDVFRCLGLKEVGGE